MTIEEAKKQQEEAVKVPGADTGAQATEQPKGSKLKDYLRGRKNDLDVDNDEDSYNYIRGEFDRLDKSDATNKRMNDLIMKDSRNAGLLSVMMSGKGANGEDTDLVGYIMENWGDEIRESVSSEDATERINAKMAKNEKAAAEEAKRNEEIQANFAKMNEALGAAMQKTGVDGAKVRQVIDWLYGSDAEDGLYIRIPKRAITEDDFVKLIYAFTRDEEIEKSRNEGITEGRKTRPGRTHRSETPDNTYLGAGGGATEEGDEEQDPMLSRYGRMKPRYT